MPNRTATAPVLDPVVEQPAERPAERHQPTLPPRQRYLFAEAAPRVIPFDSIAPSSPRPAPQVSRETETAPERQPRTAAPRRRAPRAVSDAQPSLDFLPPAPPAHAARRHVAESAIYCDAPVATLSQRFVAAALDAAIVAAGFAVMLSVFAYKTGGIVLTGYAPVIYGAMFGLLFLFYKYVSFRFAEVSPGVRWAGLRLLDFDGRQPAVRSRLHRLAAGCLSFL
ncbi:MAG: RDD family protein, partial [Bryobacteraceae bacterium]